MTDRVRPLTLTAENFQAEVIDSKTPVLVDIWASWCGPCRLINPIIEEIAARFAKRVKVGKLNVDEYGEIATCYDVGAIPTLLFFHNGIVVDRAVGVVTAKVLADKLNALLKQSVADKRQVA